MGWVAIDAKSKVLLSLQVGPRKQYVAHALVHSLVAVMAPGYVPLFTSDGLAMYFYALTAHYGSYQELEGKRKPQWMAVIDRDGIRTLAVCSDEETSSVAEVETD